MTNRRLLFAAALLALPALASAQRTRSQAASGRDKDLMDKTGKDRPSQITVRDLEEISPVKLLIDKRKDLKLSDAQLTAIKDRENKLKEANAPLMRIVDSVNRSIRPPSGEMSDEYMMRLRNARQEITSTARDIQNNYDAALKEILPTLDEAQQKKAGELLDKQREDIDKRMQSRAGRGERP